MVPSLVNPSFETGNLTGWTGTGDVLAVASGVQPARDPVDGLYYAYLTTGPVHGNVTVLSQTFSAAAGETVKGYAFFASYETCRFPDFGRVQVKSGDTVLATLYSASIPEVDCMGSISPWTYWEYTFAASGTYTLDARLTKVGESIFGFHSHLGLDVLPATPASTATAVAAATGIYGGTSTFTATLTSGATALSDRQVSFTLNGVPIGQAVTNSSGVATLSNVNLLGVSAGTYPGAVGVSFAGEANFGPSSGSAALTVNRAPLTVTADSNTKVYGGALPALTGSLVGVVTGDGITARFETPATPASDVGTYPVTATLSDPNGRLSNYTVSNTPGTLTISKADQTINWANPADIVYGTLLGASQLNATVTVVGPAPAGALTYSPTAGTVLHAGNGQTLTVTAVGTLNYNQASLSVTINVTRAALTVTADNKTKVYGATLPSLTGTLTGVVNGDRITPRFSTPVEPATDVDTYPITIVLDDPDGRLSNYAVTTNPGTFTVTKAAQTISWANPADIVYGTALDATQLNAMVTGPGPSPTGAVTYAPGAGTILNAGSSQTLTVTVAGTTNYNPASASVLINVAKAHQTIAWANPADIVYGTALSGAQLNATVFVPGPSPAGALTYTLATGTILNAGRGQTLTVSAAGTANYNLATFSVTLNVARVPLTMRVNNATKIMGEANPPFTVSYSGFVLGQGPGALGGMLTFSTPATASSAPGTYAVMPGGVTSGNYAITFVGGTLTVLSYCQTTDNLINQVNAAGLQQGLRNSLHSILNAACVSFDRGNTTAGVNQLQAFLNHVRAQRGQEINAALADMLIAAAQRIINAVG